MSALRWWGHAKPDDVALRCGEDQLTYAQFDAWTGAVGRRLAERHGVSLGDGVCVLGGNSLEWCAAAFGAVKAGGVLTPLNPRLVAVELRAIISAARAKVVLVAPAMRAVIDEVVALGEDLDVVEFSDVAQLRGAGPDGFAVDRDPDDPVMVLFTSGTTGRSKGVICTNRTLLSIVFEASLTERGLRPETTILLLLPLAFTPGLVWALSMNTVLGGTCIIEPDIDPSRAVRLIEEHQVEALFGVPIVFEALTKAPEFADADLSSLKSAVTGGAPVPLPLLKTYAEKGVALRQLYGMTEVGGGATTTIYREALEHPDTCGSGLIFTEIKVVDENGRECAAGEPGEIIMRGPSVTPGYLDDPEATAAALRDGWLYSGDLGVRDEDGRLKFLDRMKDLIISGGINLSPVEIEQVVIEVEGVEEVAVVRAADDRFGETPAAIVVGASVDEGAVIARCRAALADYKVPRYVIVRESPLPRMSNGKLDKRAIREEYPVDRIPAEHAKIR